MATGTKKLTTNNMTEQNHDSTKKSINISAKLLKSFILGFIYSICAFLILHLTNLFRSDWSRWEKRVWGHDISVGWDHDMAYSINDFILNTEHKFSGNTSYVKLEKITSSKFKDCLISVFDGHIFHILILGVIISLLIYFFSKYKINVTK